MKEITDWLLSQKDEKYRDFQVKLIPTVSKNYVIGVRTPVLRKGAKELAKRRETEDFLAELPHNYFEENQLHAFLICEDKDFSSCIEKLDVFLPYIDNWATSDQLSPPVFRQNKAELIPHIERWITSDHTYMIRFGIKQLMDLFMDSDFDLKYADMVADINSDEYYVNMMIAWYFATALAKQYESVLPYIEEHRMPVWIHNKSIQKAVESKRIPQEHKEYLKSLKA